MASCSSTQPIAGATYLSGCNDSPLVRSTELDPVYLPLDYDLGFTITPTATVGEWANILHLSATGNNCCEYGDRVPGIWFHANSYRLHIRDGATDNGNEGCDPTTELQAGVTTSVRLEIRANLITVFFDGVS